MSSLQVIKNRLDRSIRNETGVDHPVLKEGVDTDGLLTSFSLMILLLHFFFWIQVIYLTNPAVFKLWGKVIVFYKEIKFFLILWFSLMDAFVSACSVLHRTFFFHLLNIWLRLSRGEHKGQFVLEACISASTEFIRISSNILELSNAGSFLSVSIKTSRGKLWL